MSIPTGLKQSTFGALLRRLTLVPEAVRGPVGASPPPRDANHQRKGTNEQHKKPPKGSKLLKWSADYGGLTPDVEPVNDGSRNRSHVTVKYDGRDGFDAAT